MYLFSGSQCAIEHRFVHSWDCYDLQTAIDKHAPDSKSAREMTELRLRYGIDLGNSYLHREELNDVVLPHAEEKSPDSDDSASHKPLFRLFGDHEQKRFQERFRFDHDFFSKEANGTYLMAGMTVHNSYSQLQQTPGMADGTIVEVGYDENESDEEFPFALNQKKPSIYSTNPTALSAGIIQDDPILCIEDPSSGNPLPYQYLSNYRLVISGMTHHPPSSGYNAVVDHAVGAYNATVEALQEEFPAFASVIKQPIRSRRAKRNQSEAASSASSSVPLSGVIDEDEFGPVFAVPDFAKPKSKRVKKE
jgi:hypothetical protein